VLPNTDFSAHHLMLKIQHWASLQLNTIWKLLLFLWKTCPFQSSLTQAIIQDCWWKKFLSYPRRVCCTLWNKLFYFPLFIRQSHK